ncbi:hypothetical protein BP5796_06920 [Coleophoma crateriformis]|uniref:Uncharacterized protein n=1 Tax=Coleophoma crateriformis TaxID=565419 RepID=A0A3D8RPW8_9HELO|nr:hypothetical protein BP5796_06920 [Coleophoma crateriformis]
MALVPAISGPFTNAMQPHPTHPSHHHHSGSTQAARIPPALLLCIILSILAVFCFILIHWVFEPCLDLAASSRDLASEWNAENTEMQQQIESQSDESEDSSESESESESDSESGAEEVETQEEGEEEEGWDCGRDSEESLYLGDNEEDEDEDEDESSFCSMHQSSIMAVSASEAAAEDTPDSDEEENRKEPRIKDHPPVVLGDGVSFGYGTFQ